MISLFRLSPLVSPLVFSLVFSLLISSCSSTPKPIKKESTRPLTLMEKQKLRQQKNALGMSKNQRTNPNAELFNTQNQPSEEDLSDPSDSSDSSDVSAQDKNASKNTTLQTNNLNQSIIDLKQQAFAEIIKEPSQQILDKAGVLRRLHRFPVCMIRDKQQIELLPIRLYPFTVADTPIFDLIEIECIFFAYQGSFEYWLFERSTGELKPLTFDFAQEIQIQGNERITPAIIREDLSHELCGIPKVIENKGIQSTCRGDAGGSCGAYAEFELDVENHIFKKSKTKAKPCVDQMSLAPVNTDIESWPNVEALGK